MNFISRHMVTRDAREDARNGVDAKDRRMLTDLGLSPSEVARGTYEHRRAVQDAADTSIVEELRDEVHRAEDLEVLVGKPLPYTVGLVVAWTLELGGAVLVLRSLGVPAVHRPLPALALTAALIGLTRVTMEATAPRRPTVAAPAPQQGEETEGDGAPSAAPEPIVWSQYLLPVVYGVLVSAIAVIRVMGSNAEDVTPLGAFGDAVVMIAISVGPAFAAVWLETKRAAPAELARRLATLRRRLRREEKRIKDADNYLRSLDRDTSRWTQENAQRRALYSTVHDIERAQELVVHAEDANNPDNPTGR